MMTLTNIYVLLLAPIQYYIHIYTHTHTYIYIYIYIYIHTHTHIYIYIYICVYINRYIQFYFHATNCNLHYVCHDQLKSRVEGCEAGIDAVGAQIDGTNDRFTYSIKVMSQELQDTLAKMVTKVRTRDLYYTLPFPYRRGL